MNTLYNQNLTALKSDITGEQLLTLAMDIGEKMITCGAEANRVENTIFRICNAYGCQRVDVFSITSFLSTTIQLPDGHFQTQSRRIYSYSNDLDHLEHLNAVSRYICEHTPRYENILTEIDHIRKSRTFDWKIIIASYMLSSGAFAVFFGGTLLDGIMTALLAVPAFAADQKIKVHGVNMIIYDFFCTFILGLLASFLAFSGLINNLDKVLIGLVMLYIPGLQMTNAIRDMLCGDIMSGLLRLIEAVILAVSIAAGFAVSVNLFNWFA